MEPDVIEVPPPISHKQSKQKQVIINEIIDVDNYEDLDDVMIIEEKMNGKNKGKAVKNSPDDYNNKQVQENMAKLLSGVNDYDPDLLYDDPDEDSEDDYNEFVDDFMDFDDYGSPQAAFDNVNIPPPGIMQAPLPWLHDPFTEENNIANEGNSTSKGGQIPSGAADLYPPNPAYLNYGPSSLGSSSHGTPLPPSWAYGYTAQMPPPPAPVGLPQFFPHGDYASSKLNKQGGTSSTPIPNISFYNGLFPPEEAVQLPWLPDKSFFNPSTLANKNPFRNVNIPPADGPPRNPEKVNIVDILRKFQIFKRFDMVEDHSDHHYSSKGSSTKQPAKAWAKKIQDEWRILENDLPDSIFVRVYETRMDLLRAVIVGAEGTPYHDGLFFFDVFFPSDYPNKPPHVYYHSGGLRINPNLYNNGKVCLSLLGTWHGNKNENWLPGVSTALQVLVSIQALILNQKPFYNEPGYEHMSGTEKGETQSQQYNENAFMLSLKTMVYTMRKPPKHFKDFVTGHFHMRAKDIVVACKAYIQGAQVGCLVKGGVQDVDEGDKSCSKSFKEILPSCVEMLVKEFAYIGVEDSENLRTLVRGASSLSA